MLLRLPASVPEAQECMAAGAVPVGGATLVWAVWQRDGFPEQAMSLRNLPEANAVAHDGLGAAVVLNRVDDRVPEVLRRAAATVGTGAVRRTATVGGNLVGSTLRCLLPAALVLDARATVLERDRTHESPLAEVVAKQPLLLGIRWREPVASSYRKLPAEPGGPPPLVVAAAVHDEGGGRRHLRVAVRDGYDVLSDDVTCDGDTGQAVRTMNEGTVGTLHPEARDVVTQQVTDLLTRAADI
ncbi:FAD binding domain-containing protein [Streptomyces sp. NPDC000987]|uniref:FAD binding domain-containing protein n=1 Tax=Streptomyces sp. NPDC000987 TaxID=3154374 RepID=UPI003326C0BD